ncbi:Flagellar motor switch protein FliN [Stieleria neptunia]|uniref:Flagellar motor switch protein FliN n=1 Tax=Stieleria neptunia TaxID=2527979 RepID=A0A518HTE6_9BACT|nr:FliM/FliN family flagellar motor C-terminal domain-containing protein [Stieleria neptunia]QDV44128.1 Flagellar motor switch protein FliN [Stieleria neptunia]
MAETKTETPVSDDPQATSEQAQAQASETQADDSIPEFEALKPNPPQASKDLDFSRFGGVHVTLAAELGRTQLTIQELIGLAEGSVVELNRAISAPVELVAQGVPMGNGEVVVIDNQFAIRIKQIYPS